MVGPDEDELARAVAPLLTRQCGRGGDDNAVRCNRRRFAIFFRKRLFDRSQLTNAAGHPKVAVGIQKNALS
jgi:hypothetical protein